jgi:uncharacterized protein (TIGR02453 family)
MAHLTAEFTKYFKDLAKNNNRDWFQANKKRYETQVKLPFYELVAEVIGLVQKQDPEVNLEVKNAVFRINRDIRFSKDKTPYKLNVSAIISRGGRKNMEAPGIYIQIDPDRIMIAGGCYQPDKINLEKIRSHILANPKEAAKLEKDKKFLSFFPNGIGGDKNKILPKEFKEYGERYPILYNKQFFYHAEYKGQKYVTDKELARFILKHYKAGEKWMEFLRDAIES